MTLKGVKKLPVVVSKGEAIEIYQLLSRVNLKIGQLDAALTRSLIDETLLNLLSYNESVQSTRIEGTQVTFSEMMEANSGTSKLTWEQQEVKNYKEAIDEGYRMIQAGEVISTRLIKSMHEILMKKARGTSSAGGEFRQVQNFLGADNKIENATYIPVSASEIGDYMTNLEYFINGTPHSSFEVEVSDDEYIINYDSDPLLRTAIAHAQFESIHPFLDGNGRLGRILIVLMSVQQELLTQPIFFVSEELEKERIRYYNSLNATRGDDPHWETWLLFFLRACERATDNMLDKLDRVEELLRQGLSICQTDTQEKVWTGIISQPIITSTQMARLVSVHPATARKALDFLAGHALIDKDQAAKRNIKYYNYEVLRILAH